jgi:hypothetical protein
MKAIESSRKFKSNIPPAEIPRANLIEILMALRMPMAQKADAISFVREAKDVTPEYTLHPGWKGKVHSWTKAYLYKL